MGVREKLLEKEVEDQEGPRYGVGYVKYQFKQGEDDPDLILGAYKGDKLVGTIMAITYDTIFNNPKQEIKDLKLKSAFIGNVSAHKDHWPGKDIKESLIQAIIKKLEEKNIDLIVTSPLQDKDPDGVDYLKSIGFIQVNKNVEANVKLMGRHAIDHLKVAQGLNPIEAGGAKLLAGWKSDGIEEGKIRDLVESDIPKLIEILNSYQEELQFSMQWDEKQVKAVMNRLENINESEITRVNETFPDSAYGSHFKVWEINGVVKAFALLAIIEVHMTHDALPLIFLDGSGFDRTLTAEQKRDFITAVIREHDHKAIVTDLTVPYFDKKGFDKAGFMSDHRARRFLMKPLTDKASPIKTTKKIKKFLIRVLDYSI